MRNVVSGLKVKPKEQRKECDCACNGLVLELLQAMTAQSKVMAEQNKLMAQIVDQNNELIARLDVEGDELESERKYLDE